MNAEQQLLQTYAYILKWNNKHIFYGKNLAKLKKRNKKKCSVFKYRIKIEMLLSERIIQIPKMLKRLFNTDNKKYVAECKNIQNI